MRDYKANYLLLIEYDGTGFAGWQRQPRCRTIQAEIEAASRKLFKGDVMLTGTGRTDAGVHALQQAANLLAMHSLEPRRLRLGLNALLPEDIAIISVKKEALSFHSRYAAKGKVYEYRIWNHQFRTVWYKHAWHVPFPLDIAAMRKAASYCIGVQDFKAFHAAGGTQENTVVSMQDIRIRRHQGALIITFKADRFLYKMIRNIVGTLVEVGKGKITSERFKEVLKRKDRRFAGRTAPPHGLFLKKVFFK